MDGTKIKNETELLSKLNALGHLDDKTRKSVVCSLIGHSRIQEACFGYFYCARCGDQVGDQFGSVYDASKVVIVGHDCEKCRENFEALSWADKVFTPDPFGEESRNA